MNQTIISPSLLSADFLNLQKEIEAFQDISDLWFHLDIMDGHFVPNLTFGTPVIKNLPSITKHPLDAHLMVKNPELYLDLFKDIPLHNFTFHWEATKHHHRLITEAKKKFPNVGISLNPSTPINSIPELILSSVDLILIMTVNPGFGGQSFIDECIQKIQNLNKIKKQNNFKFSIQIDGGINKGTAPKVIKAGASNLVAGSYIFKHKTNEYPSAIESLRSS